MLGSLSPPVAIDIASWRAPSHWTGPWLPSMRNMSPKNGMPSKGFWSSEPMGQA